MTAVNYIVIKKDLQSYHSQCNFDVALSFFNISGISTVSLVIRKPCFSKITRFKMTIWYHNRTDMQYVNVDFLRSKEDTNGQPHFLMYLGQLTRKLFLSAVSLGGES